MNGLQTSFCKWEDPNPTPAVLENIAPGDWCPTDQTTDPCFGEATCNNNVCTVTAPVGTACCDDFGDPDTCNVRRCEVGMYCDTSGDADTGGRCQAVIASGELCTSNLQCGYGSFCNLNNDEPDGRICRFYGTLANGETIGPVDEPEKCMSGQTVNLATEDDPTNEFMCVKGVVSDAGFGKDAKLEQEGECKYTNFTTTDEENGTPGSVPAMCGFNEESFYYCPVFKGDADWLSKWEEHTKYFQDANVNTACSEASAGVGLGANTVRCAALTEAIGNDNYYEDFERTKWLVSDVQAWPNVANNAGCVKGILTKNFWMSEDSTTLPLVTSLVVALATILG